MTAAVAWTGVALGVIALGYCAVLDVFDGRRIDDLSEALDLAKDELARTVLRLTYVEDAIRAAVSPVEALEGAGRSSAMPEAVTEGSRDDSGRSDTLPAVVAFDPERYGRHAREAVGV